MSWKGLNDIQWTDDKRCLYIVMQARLVSATRDAADVHKQQCLILDLLEDNSGYDKMFPAALLKEFITWNKT